METLAHGEKLLGLVVVFTSIMCVASALVILAVYIEDSEEDDESENDK